MDLQERINLRRRRNGGNIWEFYIHHFNDSGECVYNGWYSSSEIAHNFPECTVSPQALRTRLMKYIEGDGRYDSLWACIEAKTTTPIERAVEMVEKRKTTISDKSRYACLQELGLDALKLMPAGSLASTVR